MALISIHIGSKDGSSFQVDEVRPGENVFLSLSTTCNLPSCYEGGSPLCFDSSTLTIHAADIADLRQLARDIMDALPSEQADYDGRDVPGWEGGFAANH